MAQDHTTDVALVSSLPAVPTILEVVCRTTGMGFAAVAKVTEDSWVACSVRDQIEFGLQSGGELKIETTICNEIRHHHELVVIDDVALDEIYCQHHTPAMYGFRSYVSAPILLKDGTFFGTLCAIDPSPARVSGVEVAGMFKLFAELIGFQIDAHRQVEATASSLADERRDAELREQFIAVLGHDLRNPLASIDAGVRIVSRDKLGERSVMAVDLVRRSVVRMAGLIDDVLDFARGRLGGGILVDVSERVPLAPTLVQVVDELRSSHPDRSIEVDLDGIENCRCDPSRVGQLLSNLVANALTHGSTDAPVSVRGHLDGGRLQIKVANAGVPITRNQMKGLFLPFVRASARPGQQGLGLGLYIASEIAKAHGGTLAVESGSDETVFTFEMPA